MKAFHTPAGEMAATLNRQNKPPGQILNYIIDRFYSCQQERLFNMTPKTPLCYAIGFGFFIINRLNYSALNYFAKNVHDK